MSQDWNQVKTFIDKEWDSSIIPALSDYIEVPCQSPSFDPEWATNGLMGKAMDIMIDWLKKCPIKGMTYELLEEPGRTPFLIIEVEGTTPTPKTIFMYGHMDKQPPTYPWADGLDPYKAVIRDNKLYGRAGGDDGYAIFASITTLTALQQQNIPHARTVIIIEACEESGSFDLPHYMEKCKEKIGDVDLIVCLDSGCMNYEQLWVTTSLRGVTAGTLTVNILKDSMHSGVGGGVVPDTFSIARTLLSRIENSETGEMKVPELTCEIPASTLKNMDALNDLGDGVVKQFAFVDGAGPSPDPEKNLTNVELGVKNFWKPCLTVTGCDLPEVDKAGNVIHSALNLKLSIRVPPGVDAVKATEAVKKILEANPPYGAKVTFEPEEGPASGWQAPDMKPWLEESLHKGSNDYWGKGLGVVGLGGSIPFMGMLAEMFPEAQFVVSGLLGPLSNAHGPNEFMHIPFAKGLNYCMSQVVADHYNNTKK